MLTRAIYPYRRLTQDERQAAWDAFSELAAAGERARVEGRDDPDDFNELVAAIARKIGVKVWPAYLSQLYRGTFHAW